MDVRDVHDLVRAGRVVKAPTYHAGRHGFSFLELLLALERCYHVARDDRRGPDSEASLHPGGWYALAAIPHHRRLRIEFDVDHDRDGSLILVVTAYTV